MAANVSEQNVDQMFDEALEAVLEEKQRRAKEAGVVLTSERATPDRVKIEELERELMQHPFFMKEMPKEGEPLPPLLEGFQQLMYSEDDNTRENLFENYKKDGLFHFKLKKWRLATMIFTKAMEFADDPVEKAKLYNNRAACQFHLENYRTAIQDSETALKFDNKYLKAYIRILQAYTKLQKWDGVVAAHKKYNNTLEGTKENKLEISQLYLQAIRNSKLEAAKKRKSEIAMKQQSESDEKIIQTITSRGIRMACKDFLDRDRAAMGDNKVQLTASDELIWPVLILYPHVGESDLIKEFYEHATFKEELEEILDKDSPGWDKAKEFHTNNITVLFADLRTGKYHSVDIKSTLNDVLKSSNYELPGNGIPAFIVLAKGNGQCEDLMSKMQVD